MATEQQIDRSVLAGKDRDELHTIAGAIGVKAATRMRKADLIDAILAAANGGESAADAGSPAESAKSAESANPPVRTRGQAAPGPLGARVAAPGRRRPRRVGGGGGRARRRRGRGRGADAATVWPIAPAPAPVAEPDTERRAGPTTRPTIAAPTIERRRLGRRRRPAPVPTPTENPTTRGAATTSTPRTNGSRSARATGGAGAVVAAAAVRTSRRRRSSRRVPGRPDPGAGSARPPPRGLRLPARRRLPARAEGRLRLGVAGAALRACARATSSPARHARRRATRSTRRCCGSTTSTA